LKEAEETAEASKLEEAPRELVKLAEETAEAAKLEEAPPELVKLAEETAEAVKLEEAPPELVKVVGKEEERSLTFFEGEWDGDPEWCLLWKGESDETFNFGEGGGPWQLWSLIQSLQRDCRQSSHLSKIDPLQLKVSQSQILALKLILKSPPFQIVT
jgi:hypothetical protein